MYGKFVLKSYDINWGHPEIDLKLQEKLKEMYNAIISNVTKTKSLRWSVKKYSDMSDRS